MQTLLRRGLSYRFPIPRNFQKGPDLVFRHTDFPRAGVYQRLYQVDGLSARLSGGAGLALICLTCGKNYPTTTRTRGL